MDATATEAANIGPRERRKRRLLGIVSLTVAVGVAFVLVSFGAPRWSRLVVFFPLWMAGLGLLQARDKTCIALAARGVCNMDAGEEPVVDGALASRLRKKAAAIHKRALMVAAAITFVVLLFPDFQ
ncbi:MAG: OapA N-terminal domain-containing protein [Pyrinomonadaceae bacterium]